MQFGMVDRMGSWMRQVIVFPREEVILGVNVSHPIVTNGEFVASWPLPKEIFCFIFFHLSSSLLKVING